MARENPAELTTCDVCGVSRKLPSECDCGDRWSHRG